MAWTSREGWKVIRVTSDVLAPLGLWAVAIVILAIVIEMGDR